MGPGLGGGVDSLAAYNDGVVAGGTFVLSDEKNMHYLAQWDGAAWVPLGGGLEGYAKAVIVYGGVLVAGGSFSRAGDVEATCVAQWDGTSWAPLGGGVGEVVWGFTVWNDGFGLA